MPAAYFCDGCNTKLSADDGRPNQDLRASFMGTVKDDPQILADLAWTSNQTQIEQFCGRCRPHASGYWVDKASTMAVALASYTKTIDSHRRSYFDRQLSKKNVAKQQTAESHRPLEAVK